MKREKGAELIEFSLVMIPMFGILFLVIDLSWMLFARATLQYAVRQGVRYAVTGQTIAGMGQDESIRTVVQQNSMGILSGPSGSSAITVSYFDPNANLAATASNAGGNVVQVSANAVNVFPMAPLFRSHSPLSMTVVSSDVVESSPGGLPPAR
ncbi:MAG TPA: TadE/TadG family type IV pilus assembly protein [Bryobacteraceae bacterium]|jgi:Flp pilus assembly protein TadG